MAFSADPRAVRGKHPEKRVSEEEVKPERLTVGFRGQVALSVSCRRKVAVNTVYGIGLGGIQHNSALLSVFGLHRLL